MMAGSHQRRGRIEFNRPPRLRSVLPNSEVHIPSPPQVGLGGRGSVISSLLVPMVATLATSSVFILFALASPGGNQTLMLVMGVVLVVGAVLPTSAAFIDERVRNRREGRRVEEDYRRRLRARRDELLRLREDERAIRLAQDPDVETLLARANQLDRQLWERRLHDDDFLSLRLGLGLARSAVKVRWGGQDEANSPQSPLRDEGGGLAREFELIADVPLVVPLRKVVSVGLTGPYDRTAALARAVLLQAAVHHGPDDLVFVGDARS